MRARMTRVRVIRMAAAVTVGGMTVGALAGCGDSEDDRFRAAAEKARTSTTSVAQETTVPVGNGEPSEQPGATAFPGATTTTAFVPVDPATALLQAVDGFRSALGAPQVLQLNVQFPQTSGPYAIIRYQVPDAPANVDERDWRDGKVTAAEPVRLTPLDDLTTDLWGMDSVNWNAVAAALPGVQALVEQSAGAPFEGSTGLTHLIAEYGAPFYAATVVRVYVDGGPRTTGGYVALNADGTVADVVV